MFIGCQFSIYPMSDDYIKIITSTIQDIKPHGVRILTDDISTTVVGNINNVFTYITNCYIRCLEIFDGHIAMNCLFSIGCPGEDDDQICHNHHTLAKNINSDTNSNTAGQFAIMPLKNTDYMKKIYSIIDELKASDLNYRHKHFCSYLRGDFTEVITFMKKSFSFIAEDVGHVVMNASFSSRSPSHQ